MGLLDMFRGKKDEEPEFDPLADLVLAKLRVGYLVDYDMETWEVTAHNRYRWNSGETTEEWELTLGRKKRYLELGEDDGPCWTLARKMPIGKVGSELRDHILKHEDPPDEVTVEGVTYYLDESDGGHFYPGGADAGEPLIKWDLVDEADEAFLTLEQWGETELEAALGTYVEEYQFTNILPGQPG